jgi:lipopolysaccharide export LptBFGC system permease protein LptF
MLSMGYTRVIPPAVATWIVPMLFGTVAVYLFRKIPE